MNKKLTIIYKDREISLDELEGLQDIDVCSQKRNYRVVSLIPLTRAWNPVPKSSLRETVLNEFKKSQIKSPDYSTYFIKISEFN